MNKKLLYIILHSITNILFPLISFPYASYILGPSGIGKVQFTISFTQYFALFAALGIPIYGIKEVAKRNKDPKALATIFTELICINFFSSIALSFVYCIIIYNVPYFKADQDLFIMGGLLILLSFTSLDWFYAGLEEFKGITLRSICVKLIALILLFSLVKTKNDYPYFLAITLFSILGNLLFGFLFIFKKTRFNFAKLNLKQHLKPLFYLFSGTVAASIYSVTDTVILGFLSNLEAVGLYTASTKLIKTSIPIINAMGLSMIPLLSYYYSQQNSKDFIVLLNKGFQFIVFIAIPISMGFLLLAPEFILVISGKSFIHAVPSMQILSFLPLVIGFGYYYSHLILMPMGKNRLIFISTFSGVIICIILNMILVPTMNEIGASIANLLTELVVTGCCMYFTKQNLEMPFQWQLLLKSFIVSLIFIPIVYIVRFTEMTPILTLIISIVLCAIGYFSLQYFCFHNEFLSEWLLQIKHKYFNSKITIKNND